MIARLWRGAVAAVLLPVAAVVCGLGWLYLLREHHALAYGPPVKGALALEQLALADSQPLLRDLASWALVGVPCGALLAVVAGPRALRLLPAFALGSAVLLVGAGAASDALANNARVTDRLAAQLSSPGVTVALGAVVAAALAGLSAVWALIRRRSELSGPRP